MLSCLAVLHKLALAVWFVANNMIQSRKCVRTLSALIIGGTISGVGKHTQHRNAPASITRD